MPSDYLADLQRQADEAGRAALRPPGDYLETLRRQAEEVGRAQFGATVSQALSVNPDQYAKQRQAAGRLGVTPAVVEALPTEMSAQDRFRQIERDSEGSPALRLRYSDADFAKLAHDDSGPLAAVANAVKYLVSAEPGNGLAYTLAAGLRSGNAGLWQVGRAAAENLAPLIQPLVGKILPENPLSRVASGFQSFAEQEDAAAKRISPPKQGIVAGGVESGFQSVVQNASWLPIAIAGGPLGPAVALAMMAAQQGGQAYGEAREKGLNPQQSLAYGGMQAGLEAAFEVVPLVALLKDLKAGSGFFKTLMHQAATEIPGEVATQHLQDLNEWATLNPDKPFSSYLENIPASTAQTIIATLIGVGAHTTVGHAVAKMVGENKNAEAVQAQAQALQELFARAAETKTRTRDATTFADVVQEMAKETDGAPTHVYIDAKTLMETLQQTGVDEGVFNQLAPDIQPQLAEALATNGTVELPIGKMAAHVAGTPLEAALLPHLRIGSEDAMSQFEAQEASKQSAELIKNYAEKVIAESERGEEIRASGEKVRQSVLEQLNAVNRNTKSVNEAYSTLVSAFYTATSHRLGMTPEEMFTKYPLRVTGEAVAGFEQPESPAFKAWFGDSKVVDEQGKPLVAYHGTTRDINAFRTGDKNYPGLATSELGAWFSAPTDEHWSPDAARKLAQQAAESFANTQQDLDGGPTSVYPVYLAIERPMVFETFDALQEAVDSAKSVANFRATAEAAGHDGIVVKGSRTDNGEWRDDWVAFRPEQIKSAIGNQGTYDPNDPNILKQQTRGTFNPQTLTISLLKSADLTTFLHEAGHFYLVVLADIASQPNAPFEIAQDFAKTLKWFGVKDAETWNAMSLDEQRPYHERWAESFEQFLIEGKAPSVELRPVFQRFRAWMLQVYKSLKAFLAGRRAPEGTGPLEQSAFHGTPHRGIQKFSTDKIGTGEGAQAYGWGLYFASKRAIAEHYRETLAGNSYALDGKGYGQFPSITESPERAIIENFVVATDPRGDGMTPEEAVTKIRADAQRALVQSRKNLDEVRANVGKTVDAGEGWGALREFTYTADMIPEQERSVAYNERFVAMAEALTPDSVKKNPGQLYEVDIPDDEHLLLWDKPLSEQPAKVREAIERAQFASTTEDVGAEAGALIRELAAQPGVAEWARKDLEAEAKKVETMKDPKRVAIILKPLQMEFGINPDGGAFAAVAQKFLDFAKQLNLATVGEGNNGGQALYTLLAAKLGNDKAASDALATLGIKGIKYLDGTSRSQGEGSYNYVIFSGDDVAIKNQFYQGQSENTPLGLTDEIRGVFDRLLATEEQIKEAEERARFEAVFKSAEEAGMTETEWKAYQEKHQEGTADAIDSLQERSMKDLKWAANARSKALKELQASVDAKRKEMRKTVSAEVSQEPVYAVQRWLKTGVMPDGTKTEGAKLMTSALIEMYGDGPAAPWRYLATNMLTNELGLHPDVVADMFGFTSGDEMVRAIVGAIPEAQRIDMLTEERMRAEYGEDITPEALQRMADEAVHNEARARFVATELATMQKAMKQRVGTVNVLMAAARDFAKAIVARTRVGDLKPGKYQAAERRAARMVEKAQAAGDQAGAVSAQRDKLLNLYAAKEVMAAQDEVQKMLDYLKKFDRDGTRKNIDESYLDQIDKLLERIELKQRTQRELDKRQSLAKWVAEQEELGVEVEIPDYLEEGLQLTNYKQLSMEEMRGLVDQVKQIEHLGRLKNKLLMARDKRAFQAVVDDLVTEIERYAGDREVLNRTPADMLGKSLATMRAFGFSHIKVATLARIMDGAKDGGVVWERFIRTANESGDMETRMRGEATEKLTEILKPWMKAHKMGGKGKFFQSIGRPLNSEQIMALALNIGNEGNLQRLLGGEGWTVQQIEPILATLSPSDLKVVQAVWDYFETYRPLIKELELEVFGKEPDWVEPGTDLAKGLGLTGGYFPITYDPTSSIRAEEHANAQEAKDKLKAAYNATTVRKSFTKARAKEVRGRPLELSLRGMYGGINDTIHYLSWQRWLIDTNRLLKNDSVDSAIRDHYGAEAARQFHSWRDDVARGEAPSGAFDRGAAFLRQGISAAGLAFNVMSALIQPLGINQSIKRVGATWIGKGVARYAPNPRQATKLVKSKSTFMDNRTKTRFRELNELRNQIQGQTGVKRVLAENSYFLMMQAQQVVDVPTWLGAYEKAISEGNTEERAVALSDQAVIDSQGGGQTKDLSAIERGAATTKLFTVFYSFMNTALNLGVGSWMTHEKTVAGRAKLAADMVLLYIVPAVLGAALKDALTPGDSGDWDDWDKLVKKLGKEILSYLIGLMALVREAQELGNIMSGGERVRDYQGPAGTRVISDLIQFGKQASQGEFDDAFRKAAINLTADLSGLPGAQANRTITGVEALKEGKTENPLALLFGYQEPR